MDGQRIALEARPDHEVVARVDVDRLLCIARELARLGGATHELGMRASLDVDSGEVDERLPAEGEAPGVDVRFPRRVVTFDADEALDQGLAIAAWYSLAAVYLADRIRPLLNVPPPEGPAS
jgi:hypothetical protein